MSENALCIYCGKELSSNDIDFCDRHEIDYVCEKCLDENFVLCNDCEKCISLYEAIYLDSYDAYICGDCSEEYVICEYCDEIVHVDYDACYIDSRDYYVCRSCYDEYFVECEYCGKVYDMDYIHYDTRRGCWYCAECYEKIKIIKSYDYVPDEWIFRKCDNENSPVYLGIELEVDTVDYYASHREYVAESLLEIFGDGDSVIFKNDGSLSSDGFEIVSHPCSLNYHKNIMPWKDAFNEIRENGFRSHDAHTCGLHITVSKPCENEVAKLIIFFEKHWSKILKFSRRTQSQYKEWANRYLEDDENISVDKVKDILESTCSKYRSINIVKSDVLEFRIFRGTLNTKTFYATLEFVHNLVKYVKYTSLEEILNGTWYDFVKWCEDYGECEYMVKYLERRGLY